MSKALVVIALTGAIFTSSASQAAVTYSGSFDTVVEGTSLDPVLLNAAFSWTQANWFVPHAAGGAIQGASIQTSRGRC